MMSLRSRVVSRRNFARAVASVAATGWLGRGGFEARAAVPNQGDRLLDRFCHALDPARRVQLVPPADDPRRRMVQNHWAIVPSTIADLTADQQDLALGLIRQVCTAEGFARLSRQRDEDAGGWKHDHLAVFGTTDGVGPSEWVLTGRHLTLRGSAAGVVPPGPRFWGHSVTNSAGLAWEQAQAAEVLFESLNGAQRDQVATGLDLNTLETTQLRAARCLIQSPGELFRGFDCPPTMTDLGDYCWQGFWSDSTRANTTPPHWRLIGPRMTWSFHSQPHIHSWLETT